MKVLVVGAGVIGSIYGGRLATAGHDVTLVARGRRLAEITASRGISLEDAITGKRSDIPVKTVEAPDARESYELVIVAVRNSQLASVFPLLDGLSGKPDLLFMLNCPLRVEELLGRYGRDRVLFGFAGAGGVHTDGLIRYAAVRQQQTTFGPVAGQPVTDPRRLAKLFRGVGFTTSLVGDMDAWLKTHAFFITALCGALYRSGGKSARLAKDDEGLTLLLRGTREGFQCVKSLGLKPLPTKLRLLVSWLPDRIALHMLRRFLSSRLAEFAIDGHATAASDDMADLANDCRTMVAMSGVKAPNVIRLCDYIDHHAAARA